MDALMSWAKENYDLITLFIGLLGVLIAILSLTVELKKRKDKTKKGEK